MTLVEFGTLLVDISSFGSALPVLLGAWGLLGRPAIQRAAWVWMVAALGSNLWMHAIAIQGRSTNSLMEFSLGAKALIVIYVIGELVESPRSRHWLYLGLGAFLGLWLWRGYAGDQAQDFSTYTLPTYSMMFAAAATVLVLERLRKASQAPLRDFGMLLGLATVITYAPSVAITALSTLFWKTHPEQVQMLYVPRAVFQIVGLVFYSLAFAWTIPSRSSSGSSASAG